MSNDEETKPVTYGAGSITVLEGLEAVRVRPRCTSATRTPAGCTT